MVLWLLKSLYFGASESNCSENSVVGFGNSIYVTNTYGYDYPNQVENPKTSIPKSAKFEGGLQRFDLITSDNQNFKLDSKWLLRLRATSVPKLSLVKNQLYTFSRSGLVNKNKDGNTVWFNVIDADTGKILKWTKAGRKLGCIRNTMMMAVSICGKNLYQGTMNGIFKVTPKP